MSSSTPPGAHRHASSETASGSVPGAALLALGGLSGLLAGAAGVAASEAVAHLLNGVTSPLIAVGNRAVDWAPPGLKDFAIEHFGTHDKQVLIGGVIVVVALLAIAIGVVAVRRFRTGVGVFAGLIAVATAAALTDRAATAGSGLRILPVIALVLVGIGSLVWMVGALRRREREGALGSVDGDELPAGFDRRAFLRSAVGVGVIAAVGGVIAQAAGGLAAAASRAGIRLPKPSVPADPVPDGAVLDVKGITPYVTSNNDFYRVDTALQIPDVPAEGWRLRVHGMVDKPLDLSFADLMRRRLVEKRITLTCVSNEVGGHYVGNATWLGVLLADLLEEAGVQDGADAVKSTSQDGWTAGTPLDALTDPERPSMIAIGMNGEPLPLKHGFPARMVVPGLYGYVSATKWLVDLEVTRFADFKAYWSTRGYSEKAPIKTMSRLDVPRSFAHVRAGTVPIAGVAWAQDTGIAKVEVKIDDGPWQEARLAAEDNIDTWRQWVFEWDAPSGQHTITARATDKSGYTQTAQTSGVAPDGATGLPINYVTVT
ncbi:MAG: molybdopterin-dependent oxidoreductase [Marmoricola sp.]